MTESWEDYIAKQNIQMVNIQEHAPGEDAALLKENANRQDDPGKDPADVGSDNGDA